MSKSLNVGWRKQHHVTARNYSFLTPINKVVGGRPPFPWNLRSKWPTPFRTQQFRTISARSASTVRASEKSSIITNKKSITRFPMSHRWNGVRYPQRVAQDAILLFLPVKSNHCQIMSAAKFLCVKTCLRGKVVATSFLYLTVYRRIAGDVPVYLKFSLKVTHPFRKRRFRQI